ncbi:hypothetical protein BBP40_003664 [Aspergillus hancockii]|nr:hypothetical protein BBP40_003664 [Aspergillus hancockii]
MTNALVTGELQLPGGRNRDGNEGDGSAGCGRRAKKVKIVLSPGTAPDILGNRHPELDRRASGGVSSEDVNARSVCSLLVSCRSVEVVSHRVFTSRMASPFTLTRQRSLSAFPFLTPEEFECACCAFLDRVHMVDNIDKEGWSSTRLVQQATGPILKISQSIRNTRAHPYDNTLSGSVDIEEPQVEIYEDDPEALIRVTDPDTSLQIEYSIILSATYQVPVLYFTLRQGNHPRPLGINEVYQYLVPDQYRSELHNVGVMGGISFGYHPQSGTPAFFVHPCNTADAMSQIAGQQHVTPEAYLIIWLGTVGNRLSLHLPHEIFATEGVRTLQGPG